MGKEINQVLLRIDELCSQFQWNHYRLAKVSGLPLASINSMFARNTLPTIPTLEKICNAFHISLMEFFNYDQEPKVPHITSDELELIRRYKELTRSEKKLLLAYMDGLQKVDVTEQYFFNAKSPQP